MTGKRRGAKEEKQKVAGYIVTFSDMVTLLLTFFVLLLTQSQVQDKELFNRGRDAFFESISAFGLGALLGDRPTNDFEAEKPKYPTTDPEPSEDRTLDEYRAKLQQIFERIQQSSTTLPSQLTAQQLDFSVTNVTFAAGRATLNDAARSFLSKYSVDLRQNLDARTCTLYVLGLAGDEATETQQWMLSAQRAQAVAGFLKGQLAHTAEHTGPAAEPLPWRVLWWGAGPGGNWAGQDCPDPGKSQILIAVLKSNS